MALIIAFGVFVVSMITCLALGQSILIALVIGLFAFVAVGCTKGFSPGKVYTFPGENPLVHPTATNANNPITSAIRIDCPKARQVIMDTTNTPNAIINAMLYSSSPLLKCLAV